MEDLIDLRTGKNWLWHPPGYSTAPRQLPAEPCFDDCWQGGWEEMFPNDAACDFRGRRLLDHGELWSRPWSLIEKNTDKSLAFSCLCETIHASVEKTITLSPERPALELRYRFKSLSDQDQPFHFKLHPALAIEPGDQIEMPRCQMEPVTLDFSTILGNSEKSAFPFGRSKSGAPVQIDSVPEPTAGLREFVYCSDLEEGWCGIQSRRTGSRLKLTFDSADFPYVWLFLSYGGWKGNQVAMLEPCTNIPYDLETAVRGGTSAILKARAIREFKVSVEL